MKARIVVVGGGVIGTSIAMHAARRTDPLAEPVLLLERRELAGGSSGRSGAILRQFYTDRELAGMARDSLREYAGFLARTGYPLGFRRSGVLTIGGEGTAGTRELIERNVEMLVGMGVGVRRIGADEIRRLAPGIEIADSTIAAYEEGAGFVDPVRTVGSFAALARFYGATVRVGEGVERVVVEGGRVVGVETTGGTRVEAEQVVLAAGPWMPGLLRPLGIDLPMRVLRPRQVFYEILEAPVGSAPDPGTELAHEGPEAEAERLAARDDDSPIPHPVLLDLEHGHYCRCEPTEARTRVGKMDYGDTPEVPDPDEFDESVDEEFADWARASLDARMPSYRERAEVARLAAMYTVTPDAQAILGPAPGVEGLFLACGFSGHGFKLAPSIGLGLTQMLFGEPVGAFDPGFFSPERFAGGGAEWGGQFGL